MHQANDPEGFFGDADYLLDVLAQHDKRCEDADDFMGAGEPTGNGRVGCPRRRSLCWGRA